MKAAKRRGKRSRWSSAAVALRAWINTLTELREFLSNSFCEKKITKLLNSRELT